MIILKFLLCAAVSCQNSPRASRRPGASSDWTSLKQAYNDERHGGGGENISKHYGADTCSSEIKGLQETSINVMTAWRMVYRGHRQMSCWRLEGSTGDICKCRDSEDKVLQET